jgi:hypothetical protein
MVMLTKPPSLVKVESHVFVNVARLSYFIVVECVMYRPAIPK